ncbi:UNVERIFIED_CONTAM: hypothetical protein RMT77_001656 [Armadillidium vulgare]
MENITCHYRRPNMDDPRLSYALLFTSTAVMGFGIASLLTKFNLPYIWKHKVDTKSKRHGGELVAEVLHAHGIKYVFTLVGGHISPILVGAEKLGIKVIDTRHEVTSVFAADAVARLTGTVGVAAVTAGPGLTNTVTAVKNAQMAESPLLLLGGAAVTLLKGRGALQDIDQLSLFKPICKFCATVTTVRDIVPTLRKALQVAQSGTPGPVFVELPLDVLYPYQMVSQEMAPKEHGKTITQKIVNWYLNNHLSNLYAGAWEPSDKSPLKPDISFANISTVQKCADLIMNGKKPVIVVGSQATLPPTPVNDVRQALEKIGIPCFLGGMSRGILGANSPLQMRQRRRDALKEADVIVLAGAVCDFRLSYGRGLNKKAKIIAVNRDKTQMMRNSDMFWKPTVPVVGDVGSFLKDLSGILSNYTCPNDWIQSLKERDLAKEDANKKMSEDILEQHLNPLKVFIDLEEKLPENSILIADGGDFVGTSAYILRPRGPLTWLDPGAFGTLGVGAGFALGAKLCRPDSEIWIIFGDGSLGYSLIEFDTFVRHKIPLIALVGNDAGWTQIAREQIPLFGTNVACDLAYTNYHEAVEGLGAKGILLQKGDNIQSIYEEAQKLVKEGNTVLINALIGKTKFREGSISI